MSQDKNTQNKKTKMTSKQIFAIIGIILLVLLYVVTLFAAIFDAPPATRYSPPAC